MQYDMLMWRVLHVLAGAYRVGAGRSEACTGSARVGFAGCRTIPGERRATAGEQVAQAAPRSRRNSGTGVVAAATSTR